MTEDKKHTGRVRRNIMLAGALTVGSLVGLNECNSRNSPLKPPPQDASLKEHTNYQTERMRRDLEQIEAGNYGNIFAEPPPPGHEVSTYLLLEIEKTAALKARGLIEDGKSDLYYDFAPRMNAIKDVLNSLPTPLRTAIAVRMNVRRNNLLEEERGVRTDTFKIFSKAFDSPEHMKLVLDKARVENPEADELVYNEMVRAFGDMVEAIPVRAPSGRGRK